MLRDAPFVEAPSMIGITDRAGGPFGIIERIAAAARFIEHIGRLKLRAIRPNEHDAAIVAKIEGGMISPPSGHGGPTAFVAKCGFESGRPYPYSVR